MRFYLVTFALFLASIFSTTLPISPAASQLGGAEKRPISAEDLYLLDSPGSLTLSPDAKLATYVRTWVDLKSHQRRSSLWLVDESVQRRRPLEDGEPDSRAPVFSPDGKWIAFLSTRPRPAGWKQLRPTPPASDPATDIWLIPATGGTAVPLGGPDKPYGRVFNDGFYGRLAFSPDGKRLAFVADDGQDPRTAEEKEADVYVVHPDQGEGYTGYRPAQVSVAHLDFTRKTFAAGKVERLTQDDHWYGDPQWSSDGERVVVHANRTADQESARFSINKNFDLWEIEVRTHRLRQLTFGPGPEVSPRFSPDGKRLVCLSVPRQGSHRDIFNLAIITLGESGPRTEILFDHHGPGADRPPHLAAVFPLPQECWEDNDHLVYGADQGTRSLVARVDVRTGKGGVMKIAAKEPDAPTDTLVGRLARRRQLTPPGNLFLKERLVAGTKLVSWDNGEGMRIEGLLTLPPPGVARPPYKLLLHPHGGPHSRSAAGFNFTVQFFAAQGYAVLQPNFRGSAGYGQKFIDADHSDFGGGDMRDILTGIDHLVKQKAVDPRRQFVYGISYGGFMTCWLVGHTHQFRAAVAQNAVTDLDAMWGLSDIQSWTEWEFGGRPWEVPAAMRKHSPLTYVGNVQTPTLILHSRDDRRCPLPMGQMFYRALVARKVPTQLVIYPGEGHGIRQPRHQVDVLRRALAWFERHDSK
jgi:dipeptidyl aminopeptidase/acylaminoacyl peptidase